MANSFLYCNHSCDPTLLFDVSRGSQPSDFVAVANKDLAAGDVLTFCTFELTRLPVDRMGHAAAIRLRVRIKAVPRSYSGCQAPHC